MFRSALSPSIILYSDVFFRSGSLLWISSPMLLTAVSKHRRLCSEVYAGGSGDCDDDDGTDSDTDENVYSLVQIVSHFIIFILDARFATIICQYS